MLRNLILNLLPVFVVKAMFKLKPPTASFRTTTGRVFRLLKINNDFLLAISNKKYDADIAEKLREMVNRGEAIRDAGIAGLNMLSFDERSNAMESSLEEERLSRLRKFQGVDIND